MYVQRILVAVLNWGLGHATRSQVLIRQWVDQGHEIWIAADGEAGAYLKQRFPECIHVENVPLSAPHIGKRGFSKLRMAAGALQMHKLIQSDHRLCLSLLAEHAFDFIYSDSRLGFYSPNIRSVLLTHQLTPKWPVGFAWFGQRYLNSRLAAFHEIWVPDDENSSLSGDLSRSFLNSNILRIGALSRFVASPGSAYTRFAAILLSGPEPARTHFAKRILGFFEGTGVPCLLLGKADLSIIGKLPSNVEHLPQTSDSDLAFCLQTSKHIISRMGYSTLMDLNVLQREAVLIPTAGQTEQEYLGKLHREMGHTIIQEEVLMKWTSTNWMEMLRNRDAL